MKLRRGWNRRALRAGATWTLAAGIMLGSVSSLAQPKAEPATAGTDDTARWFAQGTAAHEAGRFAEAEELFLKVWAVRKAWDVAANLGLARVNLGKHVAAAEHLAYALRWFPASEPAATKAVLERRLAASRAEIGTVRVTVSVPGAEVRIGGELKGTAPIEQEVFVAAGALTVEVRKAGYETAHRTVSIAKGGTEALSFVLESIAPLARSKIPAYVAGGIGLAGVIAGGVLIGVALTEKSDLSSKLPRDDKGNLLCARTAPDAHPDCAALRAQATQLDTFGNAGVATIVIGGVAVAGAAAYYLWPDSSPSTHGRNNRILPVVGQDGGGIVWMGRF